MSSSIKEMGMQMARSATTAALPTLSKKFSSLLKAELTSPDFSTKYNQQQQEDIWNAITNVCEVKKSEKLSSRFTRVMKKGLSGFQGGRRTRKKGRKGGMLKHAHRHYGMAKTDGRMRLGGRRRKSRKTRKSRRKKGRKSRKSRRKKGRKSRKSRKYKKGTRSKTHKGRKDFTTKKGDKVFHRKKHYVRKSRKPFMGLF